MPRSTSARLYYFTPSIYENKYVTIVKHISFETDYRLKQNALAKSVDKIYIPN